MPTRRLILATLDEPGWKSDRHGPRGRQPGARSAAWLTTTANLWVSPALDKFAAKFEAEKVGAQHGQPPARSRRRCDASGRPRARPRPGPANKGTLRRAARRAGKPWLTVQSLAAIRSWARGDDAEGAGGCRINRSVSAVEQKEKGRWSRGDVMRMRLEIVAQSGHELGR